jgi:hypothetical protein
MPKQGKVLGRMEREESGRERRYIEEGDREGGEA